MSAVSDPDAGADWHRRVIDRSLRSATRRSIDRGSNLVIAAATLLERANGDAFTVQDVANEAGQSLRTLYQYFESKDDLLLAVFEEGMRAYASMIGATVEGFDDPLERLAGALITAIRLPEHTESGITRAMTRLRLRLAQVTPELVDRSQLPLTSLFSELVEDAARAGAIQVSDVEAATFMILTLNASSVERRTMGDEPKGTPEPLGVVAFSLRGLGASLDTIRLEAVEATVLDRIVGQALQEAP